MFKKIDSQIRNPTFFFINFMKILFVCFMKYANDISSKFPMK